MDDVIYIDKTNISELLLLKEKEVGQIISEECECTFLGCFFKRFSKLRTEYYTSENPDKRYDTEEEALKHFWAHRWVFGGTIHLRFGYEDGMLRYEKNSRKVYHKNCVVIRTTTNSIFVKKFDSINEMNNYVAQLDVDKDLYPLTYDYEK